jgi:ABC-type lipoprotein export system ATPase subunit
MPLVEVRDLKKTYVSEGVSTPVLHGVSFSIEKGEFVVSPPFFKS